jgi:hypothetical protein
VDDGNVRDGDALGHGEEDVATSLDSDGVQNNNKYILQNTHSVPRQSAQQPYVSTGLSQSQ